MALIDEILNVGLNSRLVLGRHPAVTGAARRRMGRSSDRIGGRFNSSEHLPVLERRDRR